MTSENRILRELSWPFDVHSLMHSADPQVSSELFELDAYLNAHCQPELHAKARAASVWLDSATKSGLVIVAKRQETEPKQKIDYDQSELNQLKLEVEQLKNENQLLQSRIAEARRTIARETRKYDELSNRYDESQNKYENLVNVQIKHSRDRDCVAELLTHEEKSRVKFTETYIGVVEHLAPDTIVVVYEIDDDIVEQSYDRSQISDTRSLKKDANVKTYVFVVELNDDDQISDHDEVEFFEKARRRTKINGPYEF